MVAQLDHILLSELDLLDEERPLTLKDPGVQDQRVLLEVLSSPEGFISSLMQLQILNHSDLVSKNGKSEEDIGASSADGSSESEIPGTKK